MQRSKIFVFQLIALALFFTASWGCGNGGATLLITPQGPTVVLKGETLQFTSNLPSTQFSVEGGASNGTIDANGLYTPPATLPIDPRITVMGSSGAQSDTALVDLRTGDNLSFDSPDQINDVPFPVTTADLLLGGINDRLAVRVGSIQVDSTWSGLNTPTNANIFYTQEVDFLGFDPVVNLTNISTSNQFPNSLETNSLMNPGIVYTDNDDGMGGEGSFRLKFLGSTNQGDSFAVQSILDPTDPGNSQFQGSARLDMNDHLHVAFMESAGGSPFAGEIFYTRSEDNGATWSAAIPIGKPDPASGQLLPSLAVDPSGGSIYVCWPDDEGMPSGDSFEIYFSSSTDGGGSFSAPLPLTTTHEAIPCRVALGSNGEIYVLYSEDDDADTLFDVFLRKSTDGGLTFGSPVPVNSDPLNLDVGSIAYLAVDSLGRIDAVWTARSTGGAGDTGDTLMYARSVNGGMDFTPNIPIAGGSPVLAILPQALRHDVSGRLHLQFESDLNSPGMEFDVYYLMAE